MGISRPPNSPARYVAGTLIKPTGVSEYLALLLGTPSVLQLLQLIFHFNFTKLLSGLMALYTNALTWTLYPIELAMRNALSALGIALSMPDYWRHIFVLIALYVFRHAANTSRQASSASDPALISALRATQALQLTLGAILTIAVSLVLPAIIGPVPTPTGQYIFVAALCFAIWLYDVIYIAWHAMLLLSPYNMLYQARQTRRHFLHSRLKNALLRNCAAMLSGSLVTFALQKPEVASPFLFGGIASLLVIGVAWARTAIAILTRSPRLMQMAMPIDSVRLAASILRPIGLGLLLAFANVGAG